MLTSTTTIAWGDMSLVAGGVSAYYYSHVLAPANIHSISAVVNGTTINSAAPGAVVTFNRLRGVASLTIGSVTLGNGFVAGDPDTSAISPAVELLPGDRIEATVTTFATIAGGTATAVVGLSYG